MKNHPAIPADCSWRLLARFIADDTPVAQPRPRMGVRRVGRRFVSSVYNPENAKHWKQLIRLRCQLVKPPRPLPGPFKVDATFYLPRPRCYMRRKDPDGPILCDHKPDRDNLDKAVLDALNPIKIKGQTVWRGFWLDDGQVSIGTISKFYHAKNDKPHCLIEIYVPAET